MVSNILKLKPVIWVLCCWLVTIPVSASDRYQQGIDAFARGDYQAAANIWLVEAYEGSRDAQFNLGVMYLEGKGVSQNREDAIFWFSRAAEGGHTQAQYNLGHLYFEEQDNQKSLQKGVAWWKRAAEQGYGIAQYNYARALYFGIGVEKNLPQSYYWMQQSAESGEEIALRFVEAHKEEFSDIAALPIQAQPQPQPQPQEIETAKENENVAPEFSTELIADQEAEPAGQQDLIVTEADIEASSAEVDVSGSLVIEQSDEADSTELDERASFYVFLPKQSLIYSQFNTFSPVVMTEREGLMLRVMSKAGKWYEVRAPGGFPGWIDVTAGTLDKGIFTVNENAQMIFADYTDNSDGNQIGFVNKGDKLLVLSQPTAENTSWVHILSPEDNSAWIKSDAVSRVTSTDLEAGLNWQKQRLVRKSKTMDLPQSKPKPERVAVVAPENTDNGLKVEEEIQPKQALNKTEVINESNNIELFTVDEFLADFGTQQTIETENISTAQLEGVEKENMSSEDVQVESNSEVLVESLFVNDDELVIVEELDKPVVAELVWQAESNAVEAQASVKTLESNNDESDVVKVVKDVTFNDKEVSVVQSDQTTESETDVDAIQTPVLIESEISFSPTVTRAANLDHTGIHNDNQWLYSKNPNRYTLQLISVRERKKAFALFNGVGSQGQLFSTFSNGSRWYFILIGDFATVNDALNHLPQLPRWAQNAIVKSFDTLQSRRCDKLDQLDDFERHGLDQYCH